MGHSSLNTRCVLFSASPLIASSCFGHCCGRNTAATVAETELLRLFPSVGRRPLLPSATGTMAPQAMLGLRDRNALCQYLACTHGGTVAYFLPDGAVGRSSRAVRSAASLGSRRQPGSRRCAAVRSGLRLVMRCIVNIPAFAEGRVLRGLRHRGGCGGLLPPPRFEVPGGISPPPRNHGF